MPPKKSRFQQNNKKQARQATSSTLQILRPVKIRKPSAEQLEKFDALFDSRELSKNLALLRKANLPLVVISTVINLLLLNQLVKSINRFENLDESTLEIHKRIDYMTHAIFTRFGKDVSVVGIVSLCSVLNGVGLKGLSERLVKLFDSTYRPQNKEFTRHLIQSHQIGEDFIQTFEKDVDFFMEECHKASRKQLCRLIAACNIIIIALFINLFTPIYSSTDLLLFGCSLLATNLFNLINVLYDAYQLKTNLREYALKIDRNYLQLQTILNDFSNFNELIKLKLLQTSYSIFYFAREKNISVHSKINIIKCVLAEHGINARFLKKYGLILPLKFNLDNNKTRIINEQISSRLYEYTETKPLNRQLDCLGVAVATRTFSEVQRDKHGLRIVEFRVDVPTHLKSLLTLNNLQSVFPYASIEVHEESVTIKTSKPGNNDKINTLIEEITQLNYLARSAANNEIYVQATQPIETEQSTPKIKEKTRGQAAPQIQIDNAPAKAKTPLTFTFEENAVNVKEGEYYEVQPGLIGVYAPINKDRKRYSDPALHASFESVLEKKQVAKTRFAAQGVILRETGTSTCDKIKILGKFGVFRSKCEDRVKGLIGDREVDVMYFNRITKH